LAGQGQTPGQGHGQGQSHGQGHGQGHGQSRDQCHVHGQSQSQDQYERSDVTSKLVTVTVTISVMVTIPIPVRVMVMVRGTDKMSKSESEIQQLIQLEAPKFSSILWRNNSGALKDETGRLVRYGLGNNSEKINKEIKSSDLIGITHVTITHDMVGQVIGIFTAIECKAEKWKFKGDERELAQSNFINFIKTKGGIANFCNSVESFHKIIRR